MKLTEYQGKQIFSRYGLPTSVDYLAQSQEEVLAAAEALGYPVVVKAQVLTGGRGKAGGVKVAVDAASAKCAASTIIGMEIKGEVCSSVVVTKAESIQRELYIGITNNAVAGEPIMIFSAEGGMEIESVSHEKLQKFPLHPLKRPEKYELLEMLRRSGLDQAYLGKVGEIAADLITLYFSMSATTTEINPLAVLEDGRVTALDAKVVLDDAALPRLRKYHLLPAGCDAPPEEEIKGYVPMDGDVGMLTGGAGLGMGTMDMVTHFGGRVGCFLDYGAGAFRLDQPEDMVKALSFISEKSAIEKIIVNVYGGLVSCVPLAKGVLDFVQQKQPMQKIVLKVRGHDQEKAWELLRDGPVPFVTTGTTEEAVRLLLH